MGGIRNWTLGLGTFPGGARTLADAWLMTVARWQAC